MTGVVTAYYDNGGRCFGCEVAIDPSTAAYLAHEVPGDDDRAYPFCDTCAGGAWPMHPVPTLPPVSAMVSALFPLDPLR